MAQSEAVAWTQHGDMHEGKRGQRVVEGNFLNSTNLHSFFYTNEGVLCIEFRSGRSYEYEDVPLDVVEGLMGSSTPGQYFLENIKYAYSYEEV